MHHTVSVLKKIKNNVTNVITLSQGNESLKREFLTDSEHLKKIDPHPEELPERFKDNLFAIVTNQNYDENKLIKTDYKTFLYT